MTKDLISSEYVKFLEDLKSSVRNSRYQAVRAVNSELILLYHKIGSEILSKQKTFGWGSKVIARLAKDLKSSFPDMKGFSSRNLNYMRLFAESYPEIEFVQQAAAQLPWFHLVTILEKVKAEEERIFYIRQATEHGWSRPILTHQIDTKLFSRQGKAISNFKDKLPSHQYELTQQTLKDPYIFDFLSIGYEAHERELESSLIRHMEKFLLELGSGFAFVGRQYHVEVGGDDFYIDLLMYNLKLRSFIVIELKVDKFKPEYAGKMNFYLSAVDDLLKHPTDNPSIGLILCKTKNQIQAEYTLRDLSKPIGLSEYRLNEALPENLKSSLPSIEELEDTLKSDLVSDKNKNSSMIIGIAHIALLVREYDEAIDFYCKKLGFTVIEDLQLPNKRWIRLEAPGKIGSEILLTKVTNEEQLCFIGKQAGNKVLFYIHTRDFNSDYNLFCSKGVEFTENPRNEEYGRVAVFTDLYGNKIDLIEFDHTKKV